MPGTIKLYRGGPTAKRFNNAKHTAYYFNAEDRRKTIAAWIDLYKEKFDRFIIHICPDVDLKKYNKQ